MLDLAQAVPYRAPRSAELEPAASGPRAIHGITIPCTLRVGWYFGTDRFEREGEVFRVTVDDAEFR